jgi:hypothetical protein
LVGGYNDPLDHPRTRGYYDRGGLRSPPRASGGSLPLDYPPANPRGGRDRSPPPILDDRRGGGYDR